METKSKKSRDKDSHQTSKKSTKRKNAENEKNSSEILKELGEDTSQIIKKAASILEEDVAAGIMAAKEVEKILSKKGEFRPNEFNKTINRLRKDTHEIANIISDKLNEFRSSESDDLINRFQKNAHDAADIILNLVGSLPEIIDKFLQSENTRKDTTKEKQNG